MVAIYFQPEAYSMTGPKLMGRNAAGNSFLRGFVTYAQTEVLTAYVERPEEGQAFVQMVRACQAQQPCEWITPERSAALQTVGTLYYPAPGLGPLAWQRRLLGGDRAYSLCGITHTTASARVMDALTEWLTAPLQPWDAVICTSTAVRDTVRTVLEAQAQFLRDRLGATRFVLPQLPVIPLGVHSQDFVFSADQRHQARTQIGASASTLIVLFAGRLSFHAKAHPLALYQGLEAAAAGREVLLVECGWHANDFIAQAYADAAQQACPSIRVVTLDGRQPEQRAIAWAAADVFCSLSDNIQETFGLTPLEAMAAGLPVIVSDWNGYKDTVRQGIDGFCVPTCMPMAGLGLDLAQRHALGIDSYDLYCGYTSQLVAVDLEATTHALRQLFDSPALRQQLGAAGRQRVQTQFDWAQIIPRYEALWAALAEERRSYPDLLPTTPASATWPARLDPFAAFGSYPSQTLTPQTRLALARPDAADWLEHCRKLAMVSFAQAILPSEEECKSLLTALEAGPQMAGELVADLPRKRQPMVLRGLVWLLKLGVLRLVER
jgi:glycosyltransferase involved in cell wall biosynthesis